MKKFFNLTLSIIIIVTTLTSCNNAKTISDEKEYVEESQSLANESNQTLQESDNKEMPKNIEKTITVDDAINTLNNLFGNNCEVTLISDEDKNHKSGSYCFLIDYSSIFDEQMPVYTYAYVDYMTGDLSFQEAGYGQLNTDSLYYNMPSEIFPIPTIDGIIVEYDYFVPPSNGNMGTWYVFSDDSTVEQYKLQLADAGFSDLGEVQSVSSLWQYEEENENTKCVYIVEISDKGICLYINKF